MKSAMILILMASVVVASLLLGNNAMNSMKEMKNRQTIAMAEVMK